MKELIILSGKGGTGKTSLTASFARLAERPVIADCDVDAADLHLVIPPTIRQRHVFMSGHQAVVMEEVCCNCGVCLPECRFGAIMEPNPGLATTPTGSTRRPAKAAASAWKPARWTSSSSPSGAAASG